MLQGKILRNTDPGFDEAIRATVFNQRDTGRKPDIMALPQTVDEVVAAVRYARSAGLKVSVCSGGHSWSHNHLRPGSLLINMKGFDRYEINQENMTATAGPGCGGSDLLIALMRQGLFFPAGHCKGVCIGGYLLQGGFAWNGRKLGMACESVIGLDIVTADGELVHASATENADLYWAARGAGGGFFGVVLRFHLKIYPKPRYSGMLGQVFDLKHLETVFNWAYEVGPEVSPAVEFQLLMSRKTMTFFGPGIEVFAPVFADTREELEAATAFLTRSPIKGKAFLKMPFVQVPISWMYSLAMTHYPHNYHWGVDNMWTGAHIRDLMPFLKKIADTLPPAPAHVLWLNWHPPVRPDMAFSMEDKIYLALYGSWKNAADTQQYGSWATDWMREMQHLATGIQLADESLHTRPARFVSDENLRRLDEVRAARDGGGVFHEWHSRPM
jgi:hypothetical protein